MWLILRQALRGPVAKIETPALQDDWRVAGEQIQAQILAILGRALCIRQIDAGSCNACELEIHALNNPYYNIEGIGIKFVASPRHADMLLITGPLTQNMALAVQQAYEATPDPKLVVATGDCACNGGIFADSYACVGAVSKVLPVNVNIPGCPPPPLEILQGILTALQTDVSLIPANISQPGAEFRK
jgi:Ni,Fe-hydrogenase III small subunit